MSRRNTLEEEREIRDLMSQLNDSSPHNREIFGKVIDILTPDRTLNLFVMIQRRFPATFFRVMEELKREPGGEQILDEFFGPMNDVNDDEEKDQQENIKEIYIGNTNRERQGSPTFHSLGFPDSVHDSFEGTVNELLQMEATSEIVVEEGNTRSSLRGTLSSEMFREPQPPPEPKRRKL